MNPNANLNRLNNNTNATTNNDYDTPQLMETYINAFTSSIKSYSRLNNAFIDALSVPFTDARKELKEIKKDVRGGKDLLFVNYDEQQEFYKKAEKIILSKIRNKFGTNFREKSFVTSLSEFIESYCNLVKITGAGLMYQHMSNANAFWNTIFIEPIRDVMYRTPSHKIHSENKYSLFHYDLPQEFNERQKRDGENADKKEISGTKLTSNGTTPVSTPLLIIYAFINRNYILDLLPDSSIVRNFQKQGFDVYTTDWGTPSAYDKKLTVGHYVNNYLTNAVNHIIEHSNSEKVSLLGYCWGW